MNPLDRTLQEIAAELRRANVRWALIGGLAVSARAEPRTTRDIDIAVVVDSDQEAEALVSDLRARRFPLEALVEQSARGRLATARLRSTEHGIVVDLLFASSGIETETVEDAEEIEILPGIRVPVARIPHLIALKILARDDRHRPQDWDDLRALIREADATDLDSARDLLRRITERGFDRGRKLVEALDELLDPNGRA